MLRKVGLAISYFISIVYIILIVWPALYCYQHGCHGPELDGFMPAFFLTPLAGVTTAFSLRNAIQNIKKNDSSSLVFWPPAIVFSIVLVGIVGLIAWIVLQTAFHQPHR